MMILVDAHVHIYNCFELKKFFNSAYANFKSTAHDLGGGPNFTGILLLTETTKERWFQNLCYCADGKLLPSEIGIDDWMFYYTDEKWSLCAKSADSKKKLYIIAGKQIVSSEGLEVLAVGTQKKSEKANQYWNPLQVYTKTVVCL